MPSISFIVARSFPGGVIGDNNKLPWRLKSDIKRFRQITTGHVVIMGRLTFESIGRPLPNRTNIVLSRDSSRTNRGGINLDEGTQLYWTDTLEDALLVADIISICRRQDDIFVIGGETMYELFRDLVNKVYLTEVFADLRGDSYFKTRFPRKQWRLISEEDFTKNEDGDEFGYRFSVLERKERRNRYEFVSRFFTDKVEKDAWLNKQVKIHKSDISAYVQDNLDLFQQAEASRIER
jgi:dihydrofolate reductase